LSNLNEREIADSLTEPEIEFWAVDRQLFSYPLINISARHRRERYLFSSRLAGGSIPLHCVAA
jgi:hypothetical protein